MKKQIIFFLTLFTFVSIGILSATGKVYLVLGSDTAIWYGMNVARFDNMYVFDLYTDPLDNAYHVMDPAWRNQYVDSYGTPMKLTWWMMGGNIFRYAVNNNVPLNNTMTLYLMKKYHGEAIQQFGDELSLHYHTFKWTDYNADGVYWWNQSLSFTECKDDWDVTLAQYLIEEEVFPVSYRSGWHYMDNDWQEVLNEWIPYSMHNDWPAYRVDDTEPLDNTYNWSQAPSTFIPYQPSQSNYQLPGGSLGWNLRSEHFNGVRYNDLMDTLFYQANEGIDQVACFWGHLPEDDFITNLEILDSLAHRASNLYPDVEFKYCTAIEAMQLWRGTLDTVAPSISLDIAESGETVSLSITVDEQLFMTKPFVAIKDRYEQYSTIYDLDHTGGFTWSAEISMAYEDIGVIAIAATDTAGNLGIEIVHQLPDDVYIDNLDSDYNEIVGNWQSSNVSAWGNDSRYCIVQPGDSAIVSWMWHQEFDIPANIFIQVSDVLPQNQEIEFTFHSNSGVDTTSSSLIQPYHWSYIRTINGIEGEDMDIQQKIINTTQSPVTIFADAMKVSTYIRNQDIELSIPILNLGEISQSDTFTVEYPITNQGINPLVIQSITLTSGMPSPYLGEIVIPAMTTTEVPLTFYFEELGSIIDTLTIICNDPIEPLVSVPVMGNVGPYFVIIDNEDSNQYIEHGSWFTSNAQGYGPSSRYSWLNSGGRASFIDTIPIAGLYNIYEIVPTTVNATNKAVYRIYVGSIHTDSVEINQNTGSGLWSFIGQYDIPAGSSIQIEVTDPGGSTVGTVLRADAIKIQLTNELTIKGEDEKIELPGEFYLGNPYPNPFNARIRIPWSITREEKVQLTLYDLTGKQVKVLVNNTISSGVHYSVWNGTNNLGKPVSSGAYLIMLNVGDNRKPQKQKVIYLK